EAGGVGRGAGGAAGARRGAEGGGLQPVGDDAPEGGGGGREAGAGLRDPAREHSGWGKEEAPGALPRGPVVPGVPLDGRGRDGAEPPVGGRGDQPGGAVEPGGAGAAGGAGAPDGAAPGGAGDPAGDARLDRGARAAGAGAEAGPVRGAVRR